MSRSRAAPRPLGHSRLCAGIAKGGTREGATMSARRLIGAGLLLACCALALMIIAPAEALRGWLGALFLWSGVPIGALGFIMSIRIFELGRAHVCTPVTNAHHVCRLLLEQNTNQ